MEAAEVPPSMRVVVARGRGGNEVLALEERPVPRPRSGELLVRVRAAAVNPRDWMIRSGRYPLQFTLPRSGLVLGSDLAGEVAGIGPGCRRFAVGERVHAMQPGRRFGAFADFALVPEAAAARIPDALGDADAAAMTLVGLTAWQGLVDVASVGEGARVLVIGASGGVGHIAVQVARALGARVTGVCSAASAPFVLELGAEHVLDRRTPWLAEAGRDWDVVFDTFGAVGFRTARGLLAGRGIYVSTWPTPRIIGATLATRLWPPGRQCRLVAVRSDGEDLAALDALAAAGRVQVEVARRFRLEEVAEALDASRTFATRGKLVIDVALA